MARSSRNHFQKTMPEISVIMPVYNGEKYLSEAIESILSQTFKDFEFIIINDGSTDQTENIIKSYNDSRIIYKKNVENLGLSKSFNIGIALSHGEYIARMDADDISVPKRFERQIQFLKKRLAVDIVGSSMTLVDEHGEEYDTYRRQLDHVDIKFSCLFSTPMMHPTVMGKTKIFKDHHYNENLRNSEDYELWSRLLFETNTHFANIHEPLLLYRIYPHSFTQTLNLDKRAVSAYNAIQNIEHYFELNENKKTLLIHLRQEYNLSFGKLLKIFFIYLHVAVVFCRKERLSLKKSFRIYSQLFPHALFLIKYKVKRLIQ